VDPNQIGTTRWGGGWRGIDPFIISEYFDILNDMTNNIHSRQLQKVYETSFCLDPRRIWVLGEMSTVFLQATNGSDKDNIKVVVSTKLAGEK